VLALTVSAAMLFAMTVPVFAEGEGYNIAFCTKTITDDEFQKIIADNVCAAIEERGGTPTLLSSGDQTSVAVQVTQIEDMINAGVDGLIINPMDTNAVIPAVEKAHEAGIPVIFVDSGIEEGYEDLYVTYVGTDNFAAAKQAGEAATEMFNNEGKCIVVRGAQGAGPSIARGDGFIDGLGDGMEVVGDQIGDWSSDVAKEVTANMLSANPDVDCIFSCSDVMINGIISAIEDEGLVPGEDIILFSFDGAIDDMIMDGTVYCSMAQFPEEIAALAVDTMYKVLDGEVKAEDVPSFTDSGSALVNKEYLESKAE